MLLTEDIVLKEKSLLTEDLPVKEKLLVEGVLVGEGELTALCIRWCIIVAEGEGAADGLLDEGGRTVILE